MLDEIREVKSYLCNPDDDNPRISANLLFENYKGNCKLNGLKDILVLVASHFFYDFCSSENFSKDSKKKTILIMRIWCSFENDVTEEELEFAKSECEKWFATYPQAEGWLKTYHTKHCNRETHNWTNYSKKWVSQLGEKKIYKAEVATYESILAQVIARGPLKTNYLVMKNAYIDAVKNDIRDGRGKTPGTIKKRNVIKLIAAYKMLQTLHPGQKYVLLQTNRVLAWLGMSSDKDDRWCLDFTWKDEALFLKEGSSDFKKYYVNQEFLDEMDVQILESISDLSREEYLIYQDAGHQSELIKL